MKRLELRHDNKQELVLFVLEEVDSFFDISMSALDYLISQRLW